MRWPRRASASFGAARDGGGDHGGRRRRRDRRTRLLVTTLGPGLANAVNGIADAAQERVPLLVMSGVVERGIRGRYTHQILDHAALLRAAREGELRDRGGRSCRDGREGDRARHGAALRARASRPLANRGGRPRSRRSPAPAARRRLPSIPPIRRSPSLRALLAPPTAAVSPASRLRATAPRQRSSASSPSRRARAHHLQGEGRHRRDGTLRARRRRPVAEGRRDSARPVARGADLVLLPATIRSRCGPAGSRRSAPRPSVVDLTRRGRSRHARVDRRLIGCRSARCLDRAPLSPPARGYWPDGRSHAQGCASLPPSPRGGVGARRGLTTPFNAPCLRTPRDRRQRRASHSSQPSFPRGGP